MRVGIFQKVRAVSRRTRQGNRRIRCLFSALTFCVAAPSAALAQNGIAGVYRDATSRIVAEGMSAPAMAQGWNRLAELTDRYPARLSGSASLENAIRWATDRLRQDGFANVHVEKVMVPHWVRGQESAAIVQPYPQALAIAALGGSVGGDVQAEALVVGSFDELDRRAAEARGKIVVYNFAYDEAIDPLTAYRQGTQYRGNGASRAAAVGAVGALVRAIGPTGYRTPHTGAMRYADGAPKIPVAALAAEDVLKLQRLQDRGERVVLRLTLGAQMLPDVESGGRGRGELHRGPPADGLPLAR